MSTLSAGAVVGEIGVLGGDRRSATVRALTAVDVVTIPRAAFQKLLEDNPGAAEALASHALERLRRTQLIAHFNERFGVFDPDALALVEALSDRVELRAGDTLFEEGDVGDAAYLVATGRLRATRRGPDGHPEELGEIGRSELVGEISLVDGGAAHRVRPCGAGHPSDPVHARRLRPAPRALSPGRHRGGQDGPLPCTAGGGSEPAAHLPAILRHPADQPRHRRPCLRPRGRFAARRGYGGPQQREHRRRSGSAGHRAGRPRRRRQRTPRLPPPGARGDPRPPRLRAGCGVDGVEPARAPLRRSRCAGGQRSGRVRDRRARKRDVVGPRPATAPAGEPRADPRPGHDLAAGHPAMARCPRRHLSPPPAARERRRPGSAGPSPVGPRHLTRAGRRRRPRVRSPRRVQGAGGAGPPDRHDLRHQHRGRHGGGPRDGLGCRHFPGELPAELPATVRPHVPNHLHPPRRPDHSRVAGHAR